MCGTCKLFVILLAQAPQSTHPLQNLSCLSCLLAFSFIRLIINGKAKVKRLINCVCLEALQGES